MSKQVAPKHVADCHQQEPVRLIDVRTPVEFREVHAEMALNVPLDSLAPKKLIKESTHSFASLWPHCDRSHTTAAQQLASFNRNTSLGWLSLRLSVGTKSRR